jgi:hypothetical protein
MCTTHQQSTTICATEWVHQSEWDSVPWLSAAVSGAQSIQRGLMSCHSIPWFFGLSVSRNLQENAMLYGNILRPLCYPQEKVSGSQGVSCCAPCTGFHVFGIVDSGWMKTSMLQWHSGVSSIPGNSLWRRFFSWCINGVPSSAAVGIILNDLWSLIQSNPQMGFVRHRKNSVFCNIWSRPMFRRNLSPPSSVSKNKQSRKPAWKQVTRRTVALQKFQIIQETGGKWEIASRSCWLASSTEWTTCNHRVSHSVE